MTQGAKRGGGRRPMEARSVARRRQRIRVERAIFCTVPPGKPHSAVLRETQNNATSPLSTLQRLRLLDAIRNREGAFIRDPTAVRGGIFR